VSKKSKPKKSQVEGKRGSLWKYPPGELVIIGHDAIADYDETHHLYDPESNAHNAEADEAMIANVRAFGIIEPVVIERDGPRNLVVDGRTRTRWARVAAAQQAKSGEVVLEVPCIVRAGTAAEMYGVSRAANNGRRPDDSPISKARQLQRLMNMGMELEAAAQMQCIPLTRARQLYALLSLDPKVQRAVERGMAVSAAAPLAKLSRSEQVAKLAVLTATGEVTARAVKNKLRADAGKAPAETAAQKLKRIAEIIDSVYGTDGVSAYSDGQACDGLWEIRRIVRPARNGVPFSSDDAAANGESTEFGA
jgi:ParB-like chromosome segregation protein Spo0J